MKKLVFVLMAAFFALSLFSCSNASNSGGGGEPQVADWLFLLYFDADDGSINDDLYKNIRDIECAFAQTRNANGTIKEGYPSITALVLWDGISVEKKDQQQYIHPDGALYEIGADYTLEYVPEEGNEYGAGYLKLGNEFGIGANTKDLTAQAGDWLKKEPNMSDPETFTNFLKWAKSRYSSKNVVVCLQDHGSGTFKETYVDSTDSSRALCSDATNGGARFLTCKNITDALKAAGYTGADKPKILWNDLCLQATAEIVYNYAGSADYYCCSPNISYMPDYYGVFKNIKSGMTTLDVGKVMVSAYLHRYYRNPMEAPKTNEEAVDKRAGAYSMFTSSFISLDEQKVGALKKAVDDFAASLLSLKDDAPASFKSVFDNYVKQSGDSFDDCKGLAYCGSYAWLNDLGWIAKKVSDDSSLTDTVRDAATKLKDLLKNGDDKLIVYAWGGRLATKEKNPISGGWETITVNQMYLTGQSDFISKKAVAVEDNADIYGLTIVGSVWPSGLNTTPNIIVNYDDWTGFSQGWGNVIKAWLGQ